LKFLYVWVIFCSFFVLGGETTRVPFQSIEQMLQVQQTDQRKKVFQKAVHYLTTRDIEQSYLWFKKSLELGDTRALSYLGVIEFAEKRNLSKAYEYFLEGAKYGQGLSYIQLANFYKTGIWVAQDLKKAEHYYLKAIEQNDLISMYEYGLLLIDQGKKEEGRKYIQQAADKDYLPAKKYFSLENTQIKETIPNFLVRLNLENHYGQVTDFVELNNTTVITSSIDKTIKIWDIPSKSKTGELLGEITNEFGEVNAIAVSRDKKILVAGGNFDFFNKGLVRIYDIDQKKLVRVLEAGNGEITKLKFSKNGKFLVASAASKIVVWNTGDFSVHSIVETLFEPIQMLEVIETDNQDIVVASDNREIFQYSIEKKIGKRIKGIVDKYFIKNVKANRNYLFVLDVDSNITVYDMKLKKLLTKHIPGISKIFASYNSEYLIGLNTAHNSNLRVLNVYKVDNRQLKKLFTIHTAYRMSMLNGTFLSNEKFICSNVTYNNIDIWDIPNKTLETSFPKDKSSTFTLVNSYKNKLLIAKKSLKEIAQLNVSTGQIKFDPKLLQYKQYKSLPTQNKEYELKSVLNSGALEIKNVQQNIRSLLLVGKIMGFGILPNNYIVVAGRDRQFGNMEKVNKVFIYNTKGIKVAELNGHNAAVGSLAYNPKQNYLYTADINGIVKIWDLNLLEKQKFQKFQLDMGRLERARQSMGMPKVEFEKYINAQIGKEKARWFSNWLIQFKNEQKFANVDDKDVIKMFQNAYRKIQQLNPKVSIYIGENKEWIVWTEGGFFNASKNGAKYIGYHINKGHNKEAKFITYSQTYNEFYRPDLINKVLNGEDISKYIANINIDKIIKSGLPPEISFLKGRTRTKKRNLHINYKVCDEGGGVGDIVLSLNGTNILLDRENRSMLKTKRINAECYVAEKLISLQAGKNILKLVAYNKKGTIESMPDKTIIINTSVPIEKPSLFVMLVASEKYRDRDLRLKYPVDDAKAIKKSIEKISKKLFKKIDFIEVYDENVTRKKLDDYFATTSKKVKPTDVFVLFVAGHGVTDLDKGSYYFLPNNFRFTDLEAIQKQGISSDTIKKWLFQIPAQKSLVMLDTCNSGAFTKDSLSSRGIAEKMAINKLARSTGRNYITASSDDQVALEGYEGHGVFTYTVLDGFSGKAFRNGKLTVVDLAQYVEEVLPEISYKKWGYEQVPQKNLTGNDFPIGLE
jgi:WD40 repeat protein